YRLAIDEERHERSEHRQAEDVGCRAVDRVEEPATADSRKVAAILLAEHGIARPSRAQVPAQQALRGPVGHGHLAAIRLVADLDAVQVTEGDRVGLCQRREYTRE